ncbi:uncharacterized protein METZ01_LOCUS111419, partial [marine metagenome]
MTFGCVLKHNQPEGHHFEPIWPFIYNSSSYKLTR